MGVAVRMAVLEALARNLPADERPHDDAPRLSGQRPPRLHQRPPGRSARGLDEPGGLLVARRPDRRRRARTARRRRTAPAREVIDCKGHACAPA